MKKINFKELNVKPVLGNDQVVKVDIKADMANLVYTNASGVAALSLATRIYESDGEVELSPEDIEALIPLIDQYCKPLFISAIKEILE